jgi:hypothetical protein
MGTHPVFVLAGFIGEAERWAEFADAWSACLGAAPSIKYLKMSEAAKPTPSGQFRHWSAKARNDKIKALVEVIKTHPPGRAIHFTTDIQAFQEKWAPHLLRPMASPFFMSCHAMLAAVAYDVLDRHGAQQIEVIFDDNAIFKPRIQLWYPLIREAQLNHDPELQSVLPPDPLFKDDKEYVPLQAADMVAWLFRTAFSGIRTEFEWIASELHPVIPISEYSTIFTGSRMDGIVELSQRIPIPTELMARWKRRMNFNHSLGINPRRQRKLGTGNEEKE